MKFNFDNKEYDSDSLSEQGKAILAKLQNIAVRKNQLSNELSDIIILEKHYAESLKTELPKEESAKEDK